MHIVVVAVGRLKAGPERDLVARYADRAEALSRRLGLNGPKIVEVPESPASSGLARQEQEAWSILAALPPRCLLIAFDERGDTPTSAATATFLARKRDAGTPALALVIGGPDGLGTSVREAAERVVSFGAMTLPHQIVRVLVLEQLYRACTILTGHPYHRA